MKKNFNKLSKIFSKNTLKEFLQDNFDINRYIYLLDEHVCKNIEINKIENSFFYLIKYIYNLFLLHYSNEFIFKNELLNYYKNINGEFLFIDELNIGDSIADLTMVNGEKITIFEIKTDLDSFIRLDKQLNDYFKIANEVYLVISKNNIDKAMQIYGNSNIGILCLYGKEDFKIIKEAIENKSFDYKYLFNILRRKEYLNIIFDIFGITLEIPNTQIYNKAFDIIKRIDLSFFQEKIRFELLKRIKKDKLIFNEIPHEVSYLFYFSKLKAEDKKLLLKKINL